VFVGVTACPVTSALKIPFLSVGTGGVVWVGVFGVSGVVVVGVVGVVAIGVVGVPQITHPVDFAACSGVAVAHTAFCSGVLWSY
jgi:hypothetical protein